MPQRLLLAAAAIVVTAALYFGQDVLIPITLAIFIAFVLSPLVARLERLRFGRILSVSIVVVAAFAGIVGLGWFVVGQANELARRLPDYRENFQAKISVLREKVQRPIERANEVVEQIEEEITGEEKPAVAPEEPPKNGRAALLGSVQGWLTANLTTILEMLANAGIIALLVFLMLVQRHDLRDRVIALTAGNGIVLPTQALDEGTRRVSRYLLVLTCINLGHGAVVGLGLFLLGVPSSLLFGLMSATLRFIPYLGPWIAAAFPVVLSFAIGEDLTLPLLVLGFFVAIELISNNVVEPLAYQSNVGLSATAVVICAVFWTWMWGIAGLVLAIPLTVCLAIAGRFVPQLRFLHVLLSDQPVLAPAPRLYHRMLAGHVGEAIDQVTDALKAGTPLARVYDEIVLPALAIAQGDHVHRAIDGATTTDVLSGFREVIDEANDVNEALRRKEQDGVVDTPPDRALRVLCYPAGGDADALACRMLALALRLARIDAREVPHSALASEAVEAVETLEADAVCVAQLPPLALHRVRYLLKRMSARFGDLPVLVATWTSPLEPESAQARLGRDLKLHFGSTIQEMVEHARRVASAPREERPRAPAPPNAAATRSPSPSRSTG